MRFTLPDLVLIMLVAALFAWAAGEHFRPRFQPGLVIERADGTAAPESTGKPTRQKGRP